MKTLLALLLLTASTARAVTSQLGQPIRPIPVYVTSTVDVTGAFTLTFTAISAINGTAATSYFDKLTPAAWCNAQKRYQTHYLATSTTSTNTFVLASPTAAGKIIHVVAYHMYSAQATTSGGAIVNSSGRDSLTGVTVSAANVWFPNTTTAATAKQDIDTDGIDMWGPCGWPLSAGALLQCNLDKALTNGSFSIHVVWFEE